MFQRIQTTAIATAVIGAVLTASVLAAVIFFNGRMNGLAERSDAIDVVVRTLSERMELELYKLESESDRLGRMEKLIGASDLLDKQSANRELSQLVNARKEMFGGVFDFESELLGVYGVDEKAVNSGLNKMAVKSALAGVTQSGIVRIGERPAMVSISPIGGTGLENASGSLFVGRYLSPVFLNTLLGRTPADLTLALGDQVLGTSITGNAATLLVSDLSQGEWPARRKVKISGKSSYAAPILVGKTFGQTALKIIVTGVTQTGWVLKNGWLSQAIWAGVLAIFLSVGVAVFLGRRITFAFAAWKGYLSGMLPGGSDAAREPAKTKIIDADEIGAIVVQNLKSWSESFNAQNDAYRKLENRSHKIIDLLAIEDSEFAIFVRNVRRVEVRAEKDLESMRDHLGRDTASEFPEVLSALLRSIYSIRNEAALFKLQFVYKTAKSFEDYLVRLTRGEVALDSNAFEGMLSRLKELSREVSSYCDLREELLGSRTVHETEMGRNRLQIQWLKSMTARLLILIKNPSRDGFEVERIASEFEQALSLVNKQDIRALIERYDRVVEEVAERAGKNVGALKFSGLKTHFRPETMVRLKDLLGNALRNCVHHGIESPELRRKANKPTNGSITISSKVWADTVEIQIADDGRGADSERLAQKAVANGLISKAEAAAMDEGEKLALMFEPGLSTSSFVSDVAGRGVGMDIVRQSAEELGGTVEVMSVVGEGLSLRVCFPDYMSRFKTRSSVFSLRAEIEGLFASRKYLLERAGIALAVDLDPGCRSLVLADKMFVVEGWRQLLLALIAELPHGAAIRVIEIEEKIEAEPMSTGCPVVVHRIEIKTPGSIGALMKDLSESPFIDLAQEMFLEACVDLNMDQDTGYVQLAISSNLPLHLCEYPLVVLGPSDKNSVQALFEQRISTMTGGWTWQYFAYNAIAEFVEASKSGLAIAVIDQEAINDKALLEATFGIDDANVILCLQDVGAARPEQVFAAGADPLIVSGELDAAAIDQALEMSLLRMFRGKGHQEVKSLGGDFENGSDTPKNPECDSEFKAA